MPSPGKTITLLLATLIIFSACDNGVSSARVIEIIDLNDTSVLCHDPTQVNPQIYYISNSVMKCVSTHPIHWLLYFSTLDGTRNMSAEIPFKVKSAWKSCSGINQTKWNPLVRKRYYEIILEFYENVEVYSTQSILIKCVDMEDTAQSNASSWVTEIKNNAVNLKGAVTRIPTSGQDGYVDVYNSKNCSHSLALVSDSSGSEYNCLVEKFKSNELIPVKHFECDDWINCQQLATFKFTVSNFMRTAVESEGVTLCRGKWNPIYCDFGHSKCVARTKLVSKHAGIIYCQKENQTLYFPFLKNPLGGIRKHNIISNNQNDSFALVSLTKTEMNVTAEPIVTNFAFFKCSAPKFIALENFEWNVFYNTSSSTNGSESEVSESCNITRIQSPESYEEHFTCPILIDETWSEIIVTCAVHLQTGKTVKITETMNEKKKKKYRKQKSKHSGVSLPVLYSLAGMAVCFVMLLPLLIFYYRKVRRQRKQLISKEELEIFLKGGGSTLESNTYNTQSSILIPYDVGLEVPREKIQLEPILLGKGAFGIVMKGKIGKRYVAIKTINKGADGQYFRALLSELKIMSFVGKHANIVELVGANTEKIKKQSVYLIFEFCENGNVLEYIRSRRGLFVDQLNLEDAREFCNIDTTVEYENYVLKKFCSEDLLRWAIEIATGMDFIASKNVYHGDLAARNILLSHNLVAKVGDFGLAKELKDYALYVQRKECPLPLKWMSLESLRDLEFSIQSDVWSYGITLWEIFSLGSKPYPGVEWNFQAWKRLQDGERMDRPSHATESIHNILLKCWETLPQHRPEFVELKQLFQHELEKLSTC